MNKRILEIAEQSGVYFGNASMDYFGECQPAFVSTERMDLQKFTELIIKEFLEQIYSVTIDNPTDDWDQGYNQGLYTTIDLVKEYSGVED